MPLNKGIQITSDMHISVIYLKAWMWLVLVGQCYSAEEDVSMTTIIHEYSTVMPYVEMSDAEHLVPHLSPPVEPVIKNELMAQKPKQEITRSGNITSIKVICPSGLSPLSPLDVTPYNISKGNDSLLNNSSLHKATTFNVDDSDKHENAVNVSSPSSLSGSLAKVDLEALEFDQDVEVEVEYKNCHHVVADIEIPNWVRRLSLINNEGGITFQEGWANGGVNLKKLWLRVLDDVEIPDAENTASDIKGLCSVLPPTLEALDASKTPLKFLHLDTSCSARLTHLEASHASLTKVALCTPSLVTLHLSWNSLEGSLEWTSCKNGLDAVEYLQLNQNSISEASTCGWPSLRTLDLRQNSLSHLDLSTCHSANLSSVTASHNQLVTSPTLPSSLLHLDLNHNKLESLPMITSVLMTADFSHNNIFEIGKFRFKRARKLLHLSLAYNHITYLREHDLNGLRELRTLDVSHNKLREIAGTSLMSLRHLRKLNLHHNHLNTLDVRDRAALTPRTYVTLHHNPWHCVCQLVASLQELQHCPECQHQVTPVQCRERGSWIAAVPFLQSCLQAVQEVLDEDESDEDFSEEDEDDDSLSGSSNKNAAVAVPVLLILIVTGAIVAMSYRLYHRHKRAISARVNPICRQCLFCNLCGCTPTVMNNGDLNHRHGELSHIEPDSDTETEL